ncbi:TetR family transcriptional regulator [Nakamurella sp. GG22]
MSTGPGRGRGRPARYTRDDLLDLVVRVFNERGYEAASMDDLAKATGLTKSTFYHHVTGKEELLGMAVDRALGALAAVFDEEVRMPAEDVPFEEVGRPADGVRVARAARPVDGPPLAQRPVDRLQDALRRTTEVLLAELPYVTLLLRVRGNTVIERSALACRRDFDDRLAALVRDAAEAGQIRDDIEPRLVSRLLFGMVNSITEWYRPGSRSAPPQIVDAVVELAMAGLRASGVHSHPRAD